MLRTLKDECGFAMLAELGGTDYLGYPGRTRGRFEVHYVLRNLETNERWSSRRASTTRTRPSPRWSPLWPGADWMEREVYDMFGIRSRAIPTCGAS